MCCPRCWLRRCSLQLERMRIAHTLIVGPAMLMIFFSDYQWINFDTDTFYAFTDTKKRREHFRNSPRAPSKIPWPCLWHLRTLSYLSEQRGQIFRNKPQRRVVGRERGQQRTVYSGFVARDDTPGVLVMSGGRWGLLGMRILHLFSLRLQNFTSVFLRLLRSARVCKRVINP